MLKPGHPYEEEDIALGKRFIENNEGLTLHEFFEKYASPELKAWAAEEEERVRQMRKAGYV